MTIEHAPVQTKTNLYSELDSLPERILGNPQTKRFIWTTKYPDFFPTVKDDPRITPDTIVVWLRITPRKLPRVNNAYFLGVNPEGKITPLQAYRYTMGKENEPLELPTNEFLEKEIKAAQKIEKTLKR